MPLTWKQIFLIVGAFLLIFFMKVGRGRALGGKVSF